MKRTLSVLMFVALAVLPACSNSSDAAATINGHDISPGAVTRGVHGFAQSQLFREQLAQQGVTISARSKAVPTSFASQWLTSLIQTEAIQQIAKQRHVTASDQEVAQARSQFQGSDTSAQAFRQLPAFLQRQIVDSAALQLALRSSLPSTSTDQQLSQAYRQLQADCASGKLIGHILVQTPEVAQQAADRLDQGASFADVASQLSVDTGSSNQGGLLMCEGSSQWSQIDPTFRAAAEATPVGQVSDPVQTQFGYHVIEALPLTEANARPLLLATTQTADPLSRVVSRYLAKAKVWVNPRFGHLDRTNGGFQITPAVSSQPKSRPGETTTTTAPTGGSSSSGSSGGTTAP